MAFNIRPNTTQVLYPYNGHLNPNEVFGDIYNMIISQTVQYPELADNYGFVEMFRTDLTQFGDTKLFYDQDVLSSRDWLGDAEASNLLSVERPADPKCQAIVLNQYRIIKTTLDNYLTKRAWSTEGAFSTFQGIVQSMISKTKELYEATLINTFIGTMKGEAEDGAEVIDYEVPLSDITAVGEEKNRLEAQTIAQHLADLIVDMKDYTRKYNDYKFMRAYKEDELLVIWSSKFVNKINKLDLPTIFNKAGLMDKFAQHILPNRFFGTQLDTNALPNGFTVSEEGGKTYVVIGESAAGTVRAMEEYDYVSGHKFAGEELKAGDKIPLKADGSVPAYVEDEDVICKVITKDTVKYGSSFTTATDFYNPQSLTHSHMLIWGFAAPARLKGQPCVTVHAD